VPVRQQPRKVANAFSSLRKLEKASTTNGARVVMALGGQHDMQPVAQASRIHPAPSREPVCKKLHCASAGFLIS
jgi:hypothetical protein